METLLRSQNFLAQEYVSMVHQDLQLLVFPCSAFVECPTSERIRTKSAFTWQSVIGVMFGFIETVLKFQTVFSQRRANFGFVPDASYTYTLFTLTTDIIAKTIIV